MVFTLPTPVIADVFYRANDPKIDTVFSGVTWTPSNCTSSIQYTVKQSNGSALPSVITWDLATMTFSVFTSDVTFSATYTIKVTSKLLNFKYQNSTSFTFKYYIASNYDPCTFYFAWLPVPSIPNKSYVATDPMVNFTFADVKWNNSATCPTPVQWTATQDDGSGLPIELQFDATTRKFSIYTDYI